MTTYTLHTPYLEACSILPERKHRRCFEGSQKESIGSVIRSRRKAIQPGTSAGSRYFISTDQIARHSMYNTLSGVMKLSAIAGDQSLRENHTNAEITINHYKITVNSPLPTSYTLKRVKNQVKRTCIRAIAPHKFNFGTKIPLKHTATRFPGFNFLIGGVYFKNLRKLPFLSRRA